MARHQRPKTNGADDIVYAGFRLEHRCLTPVGSPTRGQWQRCLEYLMHIEKNIHFWIGDLLTYGESRWGAMYTQMIEDTGYDYATLRVFKWVAGQVAASRRREGLSFAHHKEVAGMPPDQQERILARAERDGWTREDIRHEVNRLAYEVERPAGVALVSGLHHGDCREVVATLPDESIDLLLTDPPGDGAAAPEVLDAALACASTKLKPNSHIYIFTTWQRYPETAGIVERHFTLRQTLLWVRGEQHEQILFAHKGRRHLNGGREGDVLYFDGVTAPQHPEEKPVDLLQYLIEKSTQPKEVVLDLFMGTGSTCLAASNAGRGYIGIERESRWYERARRRLDAAAEG